MDTLATNTSWSFKKVYEANYRRVLQLLARMAGADDAEDLTQTVFAKACGSLNMAAPDRAARRVRLAARSSGTRTQGDRAIA
jgi:DNA-directed RNA polymerase specialized sigma24 family protein